MRIRDRLKPGVPKNVLILLAGLMWACVGIMLLAYAHSWIASASNMNTYPFMGAGVVVALLAHHFGFLRIVDKNLKRILPLDGRMCVFSFVTLKSYGIIAVMIAMGILLRHSAIPRLYLAVVYIGIGLALILSSVRYVRVLVGELRSSGFSS